MHERLSPEALHSFRRGAPLHLTADLKQWEAKYHARWSAMGILNPVTLLKRDLRILSLALVLVIAVLISAVASQELSLAAAAAIMGLGFAAVPILAFMGMSERKQTADQTLDKALLSLSYRFGLLIQSGHSLRKALVLAMDQEVSVLNRYPAWREVRLRLLQGGDYEVALHRLLNTDHPLTKSWARCCLFGERKPETDLIEGLEAWMAEFRQTETSGESERHALGQLRLMMPAIFQFGVIMILLISPLFLGGIQP